MSNVHDVLPAAKTILAVDLGKFKSVACVLDVAAGTHRFETTPPTPPRCTTCSRRSARAGW